MKIVFILQFILITTAFSQPNNFNEFLMKGKAEFKKDFDGNYAVAVENLEKAVKLEPRNAEAHYFLGYAYSRLNSKDGNSIVDMSLPLTVKASEEFETVIKLTPKYVGEKVILSPYSKISGEWGSLAMEYLNNNQSDSARWALQEGKKRGGFSKFFLSVCRAVLDRCSDHSILLSSGDNFTYPLAYLQNVEGYRTDVSVVDISLLNAKWYPGFLVEGNHVQFDLPRPVLDTVNYRAWKDSAITIGRYTWLLKPSYKEQYILRGDLIFLSMLRANNFKRDIYFTASFLEDSRLSLGDYLEPLIIVDRLNFTDQSEMDFNRYQSAIIKLVGLVQQVNTDDPDELGFVPSFQYSILKRIVSAMRSSDNEQAIELFKVLDQYVNLDTYTGPVSYKKYADDLRKRL